MLTYTPRSASVDTGAREYPWLLFLLVFAWLWPGVFSHDLWKPSEPQVYTVIQEGGMGTLWLPTLFGTPYFDVSPLYLNLAAWFEKWLAPWAMDSYSAARFATVLFTALALTSCGVAAHKFLGKNNGRTAVLILLGSAGLWEMGHFLGARSVLFAGIGLCLWAYAAAARQVVFAALLLGVGVLLISQSAGWLVAILPLFLLPILYLISPLWRQKRYWLVFLGANIVVWSLTVFACLLFARHAPDFFKLYLDHHLWGALGGVADFRFEFNPLYYLTNLLWFAFPAYPLALWTALRLKLHQHQFGILALVWLAVALLLLSLSAERHQDNLILLLPILSILGAMQLDNLRRGAAAFLNWFGIMTFGAAAVFLWLGFFAMNYGFPAKLAERSAYFSPYYLPEIKWLPMIFAVSFTPMWLYAITRRRIRGRQAVTNWAAGMTLVWALLMTLFLPWLDAAKSHRPVVAEMEHALNVADRSALMQSCLYINPQHQEAAIAWQQYGSLPVSHTPNCRYTLYELGANEANPSGEILWQGKRPRNKHERFVLLKNH